MLVHHHAISFVPSLSSFGRRAGALSAKVVALADPIYNAADSRLAAGRRVQLASFRLGRLAGSALEADRVVTAWRESGFAAEVHTGAEASRQRLFDAMEARPAVLHLATHVLPGDDRRAAPRLALALESEQGKPQSVSVRDLASRRHAPGVVVMSGCDSGAGPVWPAAGLMGLTRGWLLSGASAVVATLWPVPDDSGEFAEILHRRLAAGRKGSTKLSTDSKELRRATARALQEAIIEARDGGRIPPVTWAAYFSMGRN